MQGEETKQASANAEPREDVPALTSVGNRQKVVVMRGESALCYSEAEVLRCKQVLECDASSEEDLLEALRYLSTIVISQDTLEETMIATAVKRLRTHDHENIARTAQRLVDKWRQEILHASSKTAKKAPSKPRGVAELLLRGSTTRQGSS